MRGDPMLNPTYMYVPATPVALVDNPLHTTYYFVMESVDIPAQQQVFMANYNGTSDENSGSDGRSWFGIQADGSIVSWSGHIGVHATESPQTTTTAGAMPRGTKCVVTIVNQNESPGTAFGRIYVNGVNCTAQSSNCVIRGAPTDVDWVLGSRNLASGLGSDGAETDVSFAGKIYDILIFDGQQHDNTAIYRTTTELRRIWGI
jgi:hypothetical protein